MSTSIALHLVYLPFLLSVRPGIHPNQWILFYLRLGLEDSTGREKSSKQCLLSWRRLGFSGQSGWTRFPNVTIKVNGFTLTTG